jgi:hypothetical protein
MDRFAGGLLSAPMTASHIKDMMLELQCVVNLIDSLGIERLGTSELEQTMARKFRNEVPESTQRNGVIRALDISYRVSERAARRTHAFCS